jgi:streptogramin lyase
MVFVINKLRWLGALLPASAILLLPAQKPKEQRVGIKTPGIQIPFARLKAEQEFPIAAGAGWVAVTAQVVISPGRAESSIARLNAKENKAEDLIAGFGQPCAGAVEAFKSWWIGNCAAGALVRMDGKDGKSIAAITTGLAKIPGGIAATADSVWVLSDTWTTLTRIDPDSNKVVSELRLPAGCSGLLAAESALWVPCPADNRLLRINTVNNQVENRIEVSAEPSAVAAGEGSIWVLCRKDGKVERIDPKTNKVAKTIELNVPDAEGAIAVGGGSVWVTQTGFPLTRIDPVTDKERVAQQFSGEGGGAVQFGFGSVLLVNSKQGTLWKLDPKRIAATFAE